MLALGKNLLNEKSKERSFDALAKFLAENPKFLIDFPVDEVVGCLEFVIGALSRDASALKVQHIRRYKEILGLFFESAFIFSPKLAQDQLRHLVSGLCDALFRFGSLPITDQNIDLVCIFSLLLRNKQSRPFLPFKRILESVQLGEKLSPPSLAMLCLFYEQLVEEETVQPVFRHLLCVLKLLVERDFNSPAIATCWRSLAEVLDLAEKRDFVFYHNSVSYLGDFLGEVHFRSRTFDVLGRLLFLVHRHLPHEHRALNFLRERFSFDLDRLVCNSILLLPWNSVDPIEYFGRVYYLLGSGNFRGINIENSIDRYILVASTFARVLESENTLKSPKQAPHELTAKQLLCYASFPFRREKSGSSAGSFENYWQFASGLCTVLPANRLDSVWGDCCFLCDNERDFYFSLLTASYLCRVKYASPFWVDKFKKSVHLQLQRGARLDSRYLCTIWSIGDALFDLLLAEGGDFSDCFLLRLFQSVQGLCFSSVIEIFGRYFKLLPAVTVESYNHYQLALHFLFWNAETLPSSSEILLTVSGHCHSIEQLVRVLKSAVTTYFEEKRDFSELPKNQLTAKERLIKIYRKIVQNIETGANIGELRLLLNDFLVFIFEEIGSKEHYVFLMMPFVERHLTIDPSLSGWIAYSFPRVFLKPPSAETETLSGAIASWVENKADLRVFLHSCVLLFFDYLETKNGQLELKHLAEKHNLFGLFDSDQFQFALLKICYQEEVRNLPNTGDLLFTDYHRALFYPQIFTGEHQSDMYPEQLVRMFAMACVQNLPIQKNLLQKILSNNPRLRAELQRDPVAFLFAYYSAGGPLGLRELEAFLGSVAIPSFSLLDGAMMDLIYSMLPNNRDVLHQLLSRYSPKLNDLFVECKEIHSADGVIGALFRELWQSAVKDQSIVAAIKDLSNDSTSFPFHRSPFHNQISPSAQEKLSAHIQMDPAVQILFSSYCCCVETIAGGKFSSCIWRARRAISSSFALSYKYLFLLISESLFHLRNNSLFESFLQSTLEVAQNASDPKVSNYILRFFSFINYPTGDAFKSSALYDLAKAYGLVAESLYFYEEVSNLHHLLDFEEFQVPTEIDIAGALTARDVPIQLTCWLGYSARCEVQELQYYHAWRNSRWQFPDPLVSDENYCYTSESLHQEIFRMLKNRSIPGELRNNLTRDFDLLGEKVEYQVLCACVDIFDGKGASISRTPNSLLEANLLIIPYEFRCFLHPNDFSAMKALWRFSIRQHNFVRAFQVCEIFPTEGLKVLYQAKTFWSQFQKARAFQLLNSIKPCNLPLLEKIFRLSMKWSAALQLERPTEIIRKLESFSVKDEHERQKATFLTARLAHSHFNTLQSTQHLDTRKRALNSQLGQLELLKRGDPENKSFRFLQQHCDNERAEIDFLQKDLDELFSSSIKYYAEYLLIAKYSEKSQQIALYSLVSLWLHGLEAGYSVPEMLIEQIPPGRFLPLSYQLLGREASLADHSSSLAVLCRNLLLQEPGIVFYQIFAIHKKIPAHLQVQKSNSAILAYAKMEFLATALIELSAESPPDSHGGKQIAISSKFKLFKVENFSTVPVITQSQAEEKTFIQRYTSSYRVLSGVNQPKLIECLGTNGRIYRQLIKGKDDLRQDAIASQIFSLANSLLKRKGSDLNLRTYRVVPLHSTSGVVQWIDNATPIGPWLSAAHERLNPGDLAPEVCRKLMTDEFERHSTTVSSKHSLFVAQILPNFHPVFRRWFLESFSSVSDWYGARLRYLHSLAVGSILGYVIGLGDRHVQNILIDRQTGDLIHIDLNLIFDQSKLLRIPEQVPFRLTPDLVDALGALGLPGKFTKCCEDTLQCLRDESEMILTTLKVFRYDPLHRWTLTRAQLAKIKRDRDCLLASPADATGATEQKAAGCQQEADRVLRETSEKLAGMQLGNSLGVSGQISSLLKIATDPKLLCRMYPGWQAWM